MHSVLPPLVILLVAAALQAPLREYSRAPSRTWRRPAITQRSALPISGGGVVYVEPGVDCPSGLGTDAVRLGVARVDPPLLDYREPGMPAAPDLVGMVIVEVRIAPDGNVSQVKTLRGDPRLAEPVMPAVRRWRYARTCLGGTPIPIIKTIALTLIRQ